MDTTRSQPDVWIRANLTKGYVQDLFDALLTWEVLPFCIIYKDSFMRDYHLGLSRYCSSALVNALVALSTLMIVEVDKQARKPPAFRLGNEHFFDDAKAVLQNGRRKSLPDFQALGILSLYKISSGCEMEARELAEAFVAGITEFYFRELSVVGVGEDEDARVRAATYCGAINLLRYVSSQNGVVIWV